MCGNDNTKDDCGCGCGGRKTKLKKLLINGTLGALSQRYPTVGYLYVAGEGVYFAQSDKERQEKVEGLIQDFTQFGVGLLLSSLFSGR